MAAVLGRVAVSLLLAAAVWPSAGVAQDDMAVRPYALQDLRLGTTLTEARQLRFLDPRQRGRVTLACSSDATPAGKEELHPFFGPAVPGGILCGFFERKEPGGEPVSAALEILGERMRLLLTFAPSQGELRLSQISARGNNDHFAHVIALMRRAYGPPADYQMSGITTVYGQVANATYFWRNGVSTIEAHLMTLDLDDMTILLSLQGPKDRH